MKELAIKYFVLCLVLALLPVSPFQRFASYFRDIPFLATLNWFIPISDMITVLEVWLVVIAVYYGIMWVLNFVGLLKN